MNCRYSFLNAEEISKTIEKLYRRVDERFPHSGLSHLCRELSDISKGTNQIVMWISRPNYPLRISIYLIIFILAVLLIGSFLSLRLPAEGMRLAEFFQMTEAALNEFLLIIAGIVAMVTLENRTKRKRIIKMINRLKSIAHIIDAHQLTKDPDIRSLKHIMTPHSPKRELSDFDLDRYLDYCAEMLSLTSKLGFLYIQNFDDPVANNATNELENLTTGLAYKIWQKIMIVRMKDNAMQ